LKSTKWPPAFTTASLKPTRRDLHHRHRRRRPHRRVWHPTLVKTWVKHRRGRYRQLQGNQGARLANIPTGNVQRATQKVRGLVKTLRPTGSYNHHTMCYRIPPALDPCTGLNFEIFRSCARYTNHPEMHEVNVQDGFLRGT
ncbi:unnamed protein product, partial [Ectocarpus sp. 4 AP-2014]